MRALWKHSICQSRPTGGSRASYNKNGAYHVEQVFAVIHN